MPDSRDHDSDGLNSYQRIFLFVLMTLVCFGTDVMALLRGDIQSYDTEPVYTMIQSGGLFLLVFRPKTFAAVLDKALVYVPSFGDGQRKVRD